MSKGHFLLSPLLLFIIILFGSCHSHNATHFVLIVTRDFLDNGNELCLQALHLKKDAIDPDTNLLSGKYRTKSSSFIDKKRTTDGDCEDIEQKNLTILFPSDSDNEYKRIQLQSKEKGSSSRGHDVFIPYPTNCFGKEYVHTAFNNLTSSVSVFNPGNDLVNVLIAAADTQSWLVNQPNGKSTSFESNATLSLKLDHDELLNLNPTAQAKKKWLQVTATKPIGLLLGGGRPETSNPSVELLPSREFFGMDYIVVHATAVKYHEVTITLLPVIVDKTTKIQIVSLQERGNTKTVSTSSFYEIKGVSESKRITADNPIQVFRTSRNAHPESLDNMLAMTIIPPADRWQWTAVVYPMVSSEESDEENKHVVSVVLKKADLQGFQVVHLVTGKDVKGRLKFESLPKTDFSFAIVNLNHEDAWYMQQIHRKLFLVMQYGQYKNGGSYAYSATSDVCGRYRNSDMRSEKASGGADKLGVDQAKVFLGLVAMFFAMMRV